MLRDFGCLSRLDWRLDVESVEAGVELRWVPESSSHQAGGLTPMP